jgi:heme-degrading monooxygenase HmoA
MFMRLVEMKVKDGQIEGLQQHYRQRIIAMLAGIPGCRYAGLMKSLHHPEECISLTLWDSERDAEAYERGGLFDTLLHETRPYLLETSESRLQLSQDLTLEYAPIPVEPVVRKLPVAARSDTLAPQQEQRGPLWVRIVSLKLRPGKREEFERLYRERVIPALRKVKGCRYIYLSERTDRRDEVLSVTSWDTKGDAEAYEESGLFMRLLESGKTTLSELYRWKLEEQEVGVTATSEDPTVENFDVIEGKAFASVDA